MKYFGYILLSAALLSCSQEEEKPVEVHWTKKESSEFSKAIAAQEEIDIRLYLEMRKDWQMIKTGSGLQYDIYEKGKGEVCKPGDIAEIEYRVTLLDGTVCYHTPSDEYVEVMVDKSDIETGLQEGLKKMRVGDRARLIIPSHLGHGLVGDLDKIPPLNTLVLDVHLLGIK